MSTNPQAPGPPSSAHPKYSVSSSQARPSSGVYILLAQEYASLTYPKDKGQSSPLLNLTDLSGYIPFPCHLLEQTSEELPVSAVSSSSFGSLLAFCSQASDPTLQPKLSLSRSPSCFPAGESNHHFSVLISLLTLISGCISLETPALPDFQDFPPSPLSTVPSPLLVHPGPWYLVTPWSSCGLMTLKSICC